MAVLFIFMYYCFLMIHTAQVCRYNVCFRYWCVRHAVNFQAVMKIIDDTRKLHIFLFVSCSLLITGIIK